jgi:ferredoxin
MSQVTFPKQGITVELLRGEPLIEAIRRAGIDLDTPCDGTGTCGKCRVKAFLASALNSGAFSDDCLTDSEHRCGWVLACQAQANDDVAVELDETANEGLQNLSDGHQAETAIHPKIPILPSWGRTPKVPFFPATRRAPTRWRTLEKTLFPEPSTVSSSTK